MDQQLPLKESLVNRFHDVCGQKELNLNRATCLLKRYPRLAQTPLDGMYPIHYAVQCSLPLVRLLVEEYGADADRFAKIMKGGFLDKTDDNNYTYREPLYYAIGREKSQPEIVEYLLARCTREGPGKNQTQALLKRAVNALLDYEWINDFKRRRDHVGRSAADQAREEKLLSWKRDPETFYRRKVESNIEPYREIIELLFRGNP